MKKITIAVVVAAAGLLLTACGSDRRGTGDAPACKTVG
jgi:predicted small secreted protein